MPPLALCKSLQQTVRLLHLLNPLPCSIVSFYFLQFYPFPPLPYYPHVSVSHFNETNQANQVNKTFSCQLLPFQLLSHFPARACSYLFGVHFLFNKLSVVPLKKNPPFSAPHFTLFAFLMVFFLLLSKLYKPTWTWFKSVKLFSKAFDNEQQSLPLCCLLPPRNNHFLFF